MGVVSPAIDAVRQTTNLHRVRITLLRGATSAARRATGAHRDIMSPARLSRCPVFAWRRTDRPVASSATGDLETGAGKLRAPPAALAADPRDAEAHSGNGETHERNAEAHEGDAGADRGDAAAHDDNAEADRGNGEAHGGDAAADSSAAALDDRYYRRDMTIPS
jgi:hypothetical protein